MDFSALRWCHQLIHQVPRRSSVTSFEHSSNLRFSRFFSFIPAGARLFCLGVLALFLTLPWNPPSAYAWSFNYDGIPTPSIVMGLDALPSDGPFAAPPRDPPSPSLAPTSIPIDCSSKSVGAIVTAVIIAFIVGICLLGILYWCVFFRHPLSIFISHARDPNGPGENCLTWLKEETKPRLSSKYRVKISFAGNHYPRKTMKELARLDVGIVVVTKEYFERKKPMIELIAFMEAQKNTRQEFKYYPYSMSLHLKT